MSLITHPLALSNNWANIRSGQEELLRSEEAKRCKYINILPQQDQLVVFGMTTFGQLSVGAENFLHDLAAIYSSAAPTAEEAEEDLEHIEQQLQLCLQRQIARMLLTDTLLSVNLFSISFIILYIAVTIRPMFFNNYKKEKQNINLFLPKKGNGGHHTPLRSVTQRK